MHFNFLILQGYTSSKEYIATQGPLANTMNDFWRMIWEQECLYIAMIGELVVKGILIKLAERDIVGGG